MVRGKHTEQEGDRVTEGEPNQTGSKAGEQMLLLGREGNWEMLVTDSLPKENTTLRSLRKGRQRGLREEEERKISTVVEKRNKTNVAHDFSEDSFFFSKQLQAIQPRKSTHTTFSSIQVSTSENLQMQIKEN